MTVRAMHTGKAGKATGFTLIEVLVGMMVAALALTAAIAALGVVQDRSAHAEEATAPVLSGAQTRALLVEWLRGARWRAPGRGERFQGLDAAEQGIASDEIVVPTTARTPLSSGVTVVRLYVDHADSTAEVGLVAELTERSEDLPRRLELLPRVAAMDVRYLRRRTEPLEWIPSWYDEGLPAAVEIRLVPVRGDSLPALLRHPIRVAMEAVR